MNGESGRKTSLSRKGVSVTVCHHMIANCRPPVSAISSLISSWRAGVVERDAHPEVVLEHLQHRLHALQLGVAVPGRLIEGDLRQPLSIRVPGISQQLARLIGIEGESSGG